MELSGCFAAKANVLFRIKKSSLISGSAIYLVANLVNAVVPLALLPVLTHYLRPDGYGQLAMFQALVAALGAFVGLRVAGAAARKFYDGDIDESQLKDFLAAGLQVLLATTVLVAVILFAFRNELSTWLGLPPALLLLSVIFSALSVIIELRLRQWQIRKIPRSYAFLQTLRSFLDLILSLILVVFVLDGVEGRIGGQLLAAAVAAILAMYLLKKDRMLEFWVWHPEHIREILRFGVPLIPHVLGLFFISYVDRLIIKEELGLASVGIYLIAIQLSGSVTLILTAVNNAYVPWLFDILKRNSEKEKRQIVRYTYAWCGVLLAGAAAGSLIGPTVIFWIADESYRYAASLIGWLFLGQAFNGMYMLVVNYIFYEKRSGIISLSTIVLGVVNVALLISLVRLWGLQGAGIAYAIIAGCRFLLVWWLAQKCHPMPWLNFLFIKRA